MNGKKGDRQIFFIKEEFPKFARRSPPGGHSNQCVYDAAGKLMLDIPAAGSADFKANEPPYLDHLFHDVWTYERAVELGGNNVDKYYEVRPRVNLE